MKLILQLIGYRYHDFIQPRLRLPHLAPGRDAKEIREKARASATVAGIFLALLVALLTMLLGSEDVIRNIQPSWQLFLVAGLGAFLPYWVLREERKISAASGEALALRQQFGKTQAEWQEIRDGLRKRHTRRQVITFILYLILFSRWYWPAPACQVLGLSGLFLSLGALVFLVASVELYDTAGGWQKFDVSEYHFHVASLASTCYLLGLAMTLVGSSLLLCLKHPRTGYWLSVVLLAFLIFLHKTERRFFDIKVLTQDDIRSQAYKIYEVRQSTGQPGSAQDDWLQAERQLLKK